MTAVLDRQPTTIRRNRLPILLGHAAVGWAGCGLIMGLGLALTTELTAEVIHAIGGPLFVAAVAWNYFKRYGDSTPLQAAAAFTGFIILVDLLLVAPVLVGSFDMFASPLGTWIPFAAIFLATYLVGRAMDRRHD